MRNKMDGTLHYTILLYYLYYIYISSYAVCKDFIRLINTGNTPNSTASVYLMILKCT